MLNKKYTWGVTIKTEHEKSNLKPAIFLHIQKTAGTSVAQMASNVYGKNNIISHIDHHVHGFEKVQSMGFISGHFGYNYVKPFMESRYSFTFLRDPIERVLSFYFYCRRSNPDEYEVNRLAQEKTIDFFLDMALDHPQVKAHIWNHQTWQLACGWNNALGKSILYYDKEIMIKEAKAHIFEFDYVGFTESFDCDMHAILNRLGVSQPIKISKTNVGGSKPRILDLPSSTRSRLQRVTEMDQILYDYALSKRLEKC